MVDGNIKHRVILSNGVAEVINFQYNINEINIVQDGTANIAVKLDTAPSAVDDDESLLLSTGIVSISMRKVAGFKQVHLLSDATTTIIWDAPTIR